MPNGTLGALFRAAPGILAQGQRGRIQGDQMRWQRDITQRKLDEEAEQNRLQREYQSLMGQNLIDWRNRSLEQDAEQSAASIAARLAERREMAERDATLRRELLQQQQGFAGQQNEMNRENARLLAQMAAASRAGQTQRRVPATLANTIGEIGGTIGEAEAALKTLQAATATGANVTGPIMGRLSRVRQALGRTSTTEVDVQSGLANVGSALMKLRSGGAITPQEFERLEPFIPSKNDREEIAATKLAGLINHLRRMRESQLEAQADAGYDVSALQARAAAGGGDDADAWARTYLTRKRTTGRKP